MVIQKGSIIKGADGIDGLDSLMLAKDLDIEIKSKIVYEINDKDLNIFIENESIDHLKEDVSDELFSNYHLYVHHNDEELTEGALRLKYKMLDILKIKE